MRPEKHPIASEPTKALAKERSQQPFFANTVTASDVRSPKGNALLADVTGDKALRIVHRGHEIKVVVTESRYLELLNFWKMFDQKGTPLPVTTAAAELAAAEREDAELDTLEAKDRD